MAPRATVFLLLLPAATACIFDRGGVPGEPDLGVEPDLSLGDGDGPMDLTDDDAGCSPSLDPSTLMLLDFEAISGTTVPDLTGDHPGTLVGDLQLVPGRAGCGEALRVPASSTGGHVAVPDSPDWELDEGSIELWVRFDSPTDGKMSQGLISRDANGTANEGHFSLIRACGGQIAVRLQRGGGNDMKCSKPVVEDRWYHVAVNFGSETGLQLFIDGSEVDEQGKVGWYVPGNACNTTLQCGSTTDGGLEGNNNPWVIGNSSHVSDEGKATPLSTPVGGVIDQVRISSTTRSF
jgi:hypothetical protein